MGVWLQDRGCEASEALGDVEEFVLVRGGVRSPPEEPTRRFLDDVLVDLDRDEATHRLSCAGGEQVKKGASIASMPCPLCRG
jgi:hypothetical protein